MSGSRDGCQRIKKPARAAGHDERKFMNDKPIFRGTESPWQCRAGLAPKTCRLITGFAILLLVGVMPCSADILVAAYYYNSVLRYDQTNGVYLGEFVAAGSGGLQSPNGITFGPEGNLYVTSQTGILKFNGQTGGFLGVFSPLAAGADGLVFGPDGNLYVATGYAASVLVLDGQNGAFLRQFGTNDLHRSSGVCFGPGGKLLVADGFNGVIRFDPTTGANLGVFASSTNFLSDGSSTDLEFGPDGNLYVTDPDNSRVLRFNGTNGAAMGVFASSQPNLCTPAGLAFGPDGDLYLVSNSYQCDHVNHDAFPQCVVRFNSASGDFIDRFACGGIQSGTFAGLQRVVFTPSTTEIKLSIRFSELEVSWPAISNTTYRVDFTTNLVNQQWFPLIPCIQATNSTARIYDPVRIDQPQRFYRVAATNCIP